MHSYTVVQIIQYACRGVRHRLLSFKLTPQLIESGSRPGPFLELQLIDYLESGVRLDCCFAMRYILGLFGLATALDQVPLRQETRPNIILILTDDQDLHMNSVNYMPLLKKHIIDHGTSYKHHYCSTAICCPSRVTLWTGRNAHNTNVTDVFPPYGQPSPYTSIII